MNETLFYLLGGVLVVLALVVSFVGLRFDKFPTSRALLVGGVSAFAVLVIGTATFAWRNAEDEQEHRETELAEDVAANEAAGDVGEAEEEAGSEGGEDTTTTTPTEADVEAGAQVFADNGCGGCHTLAAAGSTGTTGPDLDGALKGKSEEFINESIVDPGADVAQGFPPNVMPTNYGDDIPPEDLDALVQYLAVSTSGS